MAAHGPEIGRVAGLVPGRRDGLVDQRRLEVVDAAPSAAHAAEHAGEHGEAFLAVVAVTVGGGGVDHGEGVEAGRVAAEGDEGAAERLGGVLEGAPVVDHHRLAAGADNAGDQLLHQHRLARAGLAGDRDVVVAGRVGEGRPAGGLAAAPNQQQRRRRLGIDRLAAPLAMDRREVDAEAVSRVFVRPMRARSASSPPAGTMGSEASPGRQLDVALGDRAPALAVMDGAHRLLGLVDGVERGVDRDRVAGPDQALAVLEALGDRLPVARLLGQAGQVAGDAGAGLLGRPGRLEEGALAVRGPRRS